MVYFVQDNGKIQILHHKIYIKKTHFSLSMYQLMRIHIHFSFHILKCSLLEITSEIFSQCNVKVFFCDMHQVQIVHDLHTTF